MAFDPVKIPQNVYIEDRIFGPITLRHIFMLLAGGGVSYALWAVLRQAGYVNMVAGTISALPTVIMILFAFVKISQISLARFCLLMIERYKKPAIRYWQPRTGIEIRLYKQSIKPEDLEDDEPEESPQSAQEIDQLSSVLDTEVIQQKTEKPVSTPS